MKLLSQDKLKYLWVLWYIIVCLSYILFGENTFVVDTYIWYVILDENTLLLY